MRKRIGIVAAMMAICLLIGVTLHAQASSGQLWVRLFEDGNANSVRDAGEALLTRGASVELQTPDGVTIGTALLEDSPLADQGLIAFQYLLPGMYRVLISTPEYAPTSESLYTRTISDSGVPEVIEFGAQKVIAPFVAGESTARGIFGLPIYLGTTDQVARVAAGIAGGLIVSALMTMIGMGILLGIVRPRALRTLRQRMTAV